MAAGVIKASSSDNLALVSSTGPLKELFSSRDYERVDIM